MYVSCATGRGEFVKGERERERERERQTRTPVDIHQFTSKSKLSNLFLRLFLKREEGSFANGRRLPPPALQLLGEDGKSNVTVTMMTSGVAADEEEEEEVWCGMAPNEAKTGVKREQNTFP
ncbi:hypothetical protein RUM44_012334 [Polyplax serrata]|uniref:Uncharacterized protein n=1 Tax=Polyplax serrata TaxID=468196 RepID=A0ABR1BB04_POLSC